MQSEGAEERLFGGLDGLMGQGRSVRKRAGEFLTSHFQDVKMKVAILASWRCRG
ncbi:hypothetical protein GCWU000341_02097 [Oribacterium sp. oral taxon 078 str. F0262]|nr:hypothetical protein GCWU000341_02097 [Oribacterium sp. oral taxon 078 str. F0262]